MRSERTLTFESFASDKDFKAVLSGLSRQYFISTVQSFLSLDLKLHSLFEQYTNSRQFKLRGYRV